MIKRIVLCSIFLTMLGTGTADAKVYKGGEYRTKASYLYGRFEVRMKAAQREGMLSSFFTYNDMTPFDSQKWNEIDIEIMGRYADEIQYNTITPGQTNHVGRRITPFNPSLEFHTYAIEWTPTYVAWFIDGVESYRQTGAQIQTLIHPQKIMMNIWIQSAAMKNWSGVWNENALPAFAYYDHVSYSSFTPDSGTSGTNNNFTLQWKDDMNAYDPARWDRATHTFNDNQCDFIPENIVFKDGMMVLCLTKETQTGYQDVVPPNVSLARAEADGLMIYFLEEVDSASVVKLSNYIVQSNTVTNAVLYSDKKTVRLTLAAYDTSTLTSVILMNIKDRHVPANTLTGKSVTIAKPQRLSFPLKINCGGPAFGEVKADQMWDANLEYGYLDGYQHQNTLTTTGSGDPQFFKSELNGLAEYRVRVPNGTYMVFLMMAENYFTAPGKRMFDVAVQGTVVEKDLDLFAKVGKGVQYQKVVTNVIVNEGLLDIHMMPSIDNALLNGISIVQLSTTAVQGGSSIPPVQWNVGQNFPNPFNGSTIIPFTIAEDDDITIEFYDALGRRAAVRPLGKLSRGAHSITWNSADLAGGTTASGAYFYVVRGSRSTIVRKMMLVQ